MGLSTVLKAKCREVKSSNHAGRLRAAGLLPVIFYGPGLDTALSLSLDYKEFKTAFLTSEGNRSLFTLDIEGQGTQAAFLKDYQVDSLSRKVVHADFYKVDLGKPVTVKAPIVLQGKPIGVEKGGQLQQVAREVSVIALPENAPAEVVVDVGPLALGQSLHFSQIPPCDSFALSYTVDLPIATVVIPKGMKAEMAAAETQVEAAPAAATKKGKK
ncbi:MAG: 50S ribosomal protein L25 [Candidatus Adiutrix sp.]